MRAPSPFRKINTSSEKAIGIPSKKINKDTELENKNTSEIALNAYLYVHLLILNVFHKNFLSLLEEILKNISQIIRDTIVKLNDSGIYSSFR